MAASEQRGLSTHADAADRYTTHGSGDVVVKRCFGVEMVDTLHHALPSRHPACRHLKNHGGVSGSLTRVRSAVLSNEYRYVFRTDIRGYYAHFSKSRLLAWLFTRIEHPVYRDLLTQYVHYSVEWAESFYTDFRDCAGLFVEPVARWMLCLPRR